MFVFCSFDGRCWKGLLARRANFRLILETFGCHLGDFFGIRSMSENVCFTIVKQYFGRFGRVLIPDFFVLFFLSVFHEHSLLTFLDFVGSQGLHRDPNGFHLRSLRSQIWV